MAAFVRSRGVAPGQIVVSHNWSPAGLVPLPHTAANDLRTSWGLAGKFVVMYSGNLGRVHDLDPVLSIAGELRTERDILFLFVGDGAQKSRLQSAAKACGLTNIMFQPARPRYDLGKALALADLHLVTLREGCERFVFPSKLYGIAAVGRPVLFIGPRNCELARTVKTQGFGLAFNRTEITSATAVIRELRNLPNRCTAMGKAAEAFYARSGGLALSVAIWDALLSSVKPLADHRSTQPK
jgi:glycosyltransferase involved in cell wall biosynthesis